MCYPRMESASGLAKVKMAAGSGAVVKLSPAGSVSSRHLWFGQRTLVRMFKYFFAFLSVIDNTSTTACDAVSD